MTTDTPSPLPSLLGYLDVCDRDRIAGWAVDPVNEHQPVRLCILQDGVMLDEITADLLRADLVGGPRDGVCAFDWEWPVSLPHEGCRIDVVDAASGRPVTGSPVWIEPLPSRLRGQVDVVDRQHIAGWVHDDDAPDRTVWLTVQIDGRPAGRFAANQFRRDLRDAGLTTGRYGFDHIFTAPLDPLQDHSIQLMHGSERFGEICHIPASGTLDAPYRRHVSTLLGALTDPAAQQDALAFLTGETVQLRARIGSDLTGRRQRDLAQRAGRRHENLLSPPPCALFVDDRAPDQTLDAGSNALLSHMQAVRELGYRCCFIASRQPPTAQEQAMLAALDIECLMPPVFNGPEDALRVLGDGLEVVYLHRLNNGECYAALTRAFAPTATLVWSVADLASVRLQRQGTVESRPELLRVARRMEVRENMCAWLADAVLTHSPSEQDRLQRTVPTANVHLVPWAVPLLPPPRNSRRNAARKGPPVIAFIAHFAHSPNVDAAKWLVLDIMPRLRKQLPGLRCRLIGSAMPHEVHVLASDDVEIAGYVPDLATVLGDVSVCVAPLRYGAGIKGKVLESWARGLPIAMTPIAAEGIVASDTSLWEQTVADTADGLAKRIIALLDPETARTTVRAGRQILSRRFSPRVIRQQLAAILPEVETATSLPAEDDIPSA